MKKEECKIVEYKYESPRGVFHGIVRSDTNPSFTHWYFVNIFTNTLTWHEPIGLINEKKCTIKTFDPEEYPEYLI